MLFSVLPLSVMFFVIASHIIVFIRFEVQKLRDPVAPGLRDSCIDALRREVYSAALADVWDCLINPVKIIV